MFCSVADWARDLPEEAHGPLLQPVVTAPTPGHYYCMAVVKEAGELVPRDLPAEVRLFARDHCLAVGPGDWQDSCKSILAVAIELPLHCMPGRCVCFLHVAPLKSCKSYHERVCKPHIHHLHMFWRCSSLDCL